MDPIAREHVQQAKDIYAKAKTGVHVLILGPYHPEGEKAHLLSLRTDLK